MALKVKIAKPVTKRGWGILILQVAVACVALIALTVFAVGGYYYFRYQGIVDARLQQPLFATTAKIYAAPREVRPGQKLSLNAIANELRTAGYSAEGTGSASPLGTYSEGSSSITVHPGPQSFIRTDVVDHFNNGQVDSLTDDRGQGLSSYELEPLLVTGLSDGANRTKRRLITYDEIPPNLVQAVLAIEDRQFFEHSGVNFWRLAAAAERDIVSGQKKQGGSTLTMQLARGFFLTPEKRWKRKMIEIAITFQLEHRFNKQQIFTMYANEIAWPAGQLPSTASAKLRRRTLARASSS